MQLPAWILTKKLTEALSPQVLRAALGPGESEAICLGVETKASLVLLDERPARRQALALGLLVIGTLGMLLASKRRGFLPAVRPSLDELMQGGFRASQSLLYAVLTDAGETS